MVVKHGGKYLVRGGAMAQAKAWYNDPAYAPLIKLRQTGSDLDFVLVEGV